MAERRARGNAQMERRTKRRQDPSSSDTAEDDVMIYGFLFQNRIDQVEAFVSHFLPRKISEPKYFDTPWFREEGFVVVDLLHRAHLLQLAEVSCSYSDVLVKAFYKNLRYADNELRSKVCGIPIVMTSVVWTELLGFDFDAMDDAVMLSVDQIAIEGYDRANIVNVVIRPEVNLQRVSHIGVGLLTVEARLLFYVMTHIVFQREHNHSRVLETDLVIMWAIYNDIKVNWRHFICTLMMSYKRKPKSPISHAFMVQWILNYFEVPTDNVQMRNTSSWNSVFGQKLFVKCGMHKDRHGVWTWKSLPVPEVVSDNDGGDGSDDDGGDVPVAHDDVYGIEADMINPSIRDVYMSIQSMRREQREYWTAVGTRLDAVETRLGQLEITHTREKMDDDDS